MVADSTPVTAAGLTARGRQVSAPAAVGGAWKASLRWNSSPRSHRSTRRFSMIQGRSASKLTFIENPLPPRYMRRPPPVPVQTAMASNIRADMYSGMGAGQDDLVGLEQAAAVAVHVLVGDHVVRPVPS